MDNKTENIEKKIETFLLMRTKKFSNTCMNGDTQTISDNESGNTLPPYASMAFLPVICQSNLRF